MPATPQIRFSHHFPGTVWATMGVSKKDILIIEVRDDAKFQVQFSAFDYRNNQFLWQGVTLKEDWWAGLTAARENTLLFHTYLNKGGNPDHKNLIAFDIFRKSIRWEIAEFSFFDWDETEIWGYRTGEELTPAVIQIESGVLTERAWPATPPSEGTNVIRPVRYVEGSPYFETVGKFIRQKTNYQPLKGVEYLEWKQWMMVSLYVEEASSLANYLLVFSLEGEVLLEVKLGEKLTGLGTDTFFMLSGCLFLIKNKSELAAYTFYD